jgi:hypothetical protein
LSILRATLSGIRLRIRISPPENHWPVPGNYMSLSRRDHMNVFATDVGCRSRYTLHRGTMEGMDSRTLAKDERQ